jgi:integrase/recombinase XerC
MNNSLTLTSPLPLDQNPAAVYIASLGGIHSTGGRTQAQALRVIARVCDTDPDSLNWASLRYQHTAAIRSRLASEYAPATANKMLSALRQTLKQAWLLGQMSVDDYMRASKLEPVTGETVPAGRELSPDEIKALIDACKADPNTHAGTRDAAMIALMYIALLRREEVATLSLDNYDPKTGRLTLTGKRNKQRSDYITNGARDALNDWLSIRGTQPGALFIAVNKSGKLDAQCDHMSPQAIYNMAAKRGLSAGLSHFSPHDFRRTGISDYLDAGVDIVTVSKVAGQKNVQTTARYDRRPEEAKRKAANLLHVPY